MIRGDERDFDDPADVLEAYQAYGTIGRFILLAWSLSTGSI
jgi:hypothetical protein